MTEHTTVSLSQLERTHRIDAEFFRAKFRVVDERMATINSAPLTRFVSVSDGNHATIADHFVEEGIPYYRGQDCVGHFFIETSQPKKITREIFNRPQLLRSHLKKGDVLLSIIGTIGDLSLVSSSQPATCSCKLAVLRPKNVAGGVLATFLKCKYGAYQIERLVRGAVQRGLILEDMDQIHVPYFDKDFSKYICKRIDEAREATSRSFEYQSIALHFFGNAINIQDWLSSQQNFSIVTLEQVYSSRRIDAEHFQRKYLDLFQKLQKAGAHEFVSLGEISDSLTNGHTPLRHDLSKGSVSFLCAEHVHPFILDLNSEKRVSRYHHENELARTKLLPGDILFTIKGRVGSVAIVPDINQPLNVNQDVAVIRVSSRVPKWYIAAFLNSPAGQAHIEQVSTGAINPFVGLGNLADIKIPLFDVETMHYIADNARYYAELSRTLANESRNIITECIIEVERFIERD